MIHGLVVFSVPCRGSGWHPIISTPLCSSQHEVSAVGLWLLPGLRGAGGQVGFGGPRSAPSAALTCLLSGGQHIMRPSRPWPPWSSAALGGRAGGVCAHLAGTEREALGGTVGQGHPQGPDPGLQAAPPSLPTYDPAQNTRPRGAKGLWQDWPPTGLTWVGVRALCQEGPPASPLLPEPAGPTCAAWPLPCGKAQVPPATSLPDGRQRQAAPGWAGGSWPAPRTPSRACPRPRESPGCLWESWVLGPAFPRSLCGQGRTLPSGLRLLPYSRVLGLPLRQAGPCPRPSPRGAQPSLLPALPPCRTSKPKKRTYASATRRPLFIFNPKTSLKGRK